MKAIIVAAALAAVAGAAAAQPGRDRDGAPTPSAPLGPPRAFSGYNQPDITPGLCRNINPSFTQCTIPAGTAGRYLIHAAGTSSAPRAAAKQQLSILIGDQTNARSCATATNSNAWPSGARTFRLDCTVTIVTDRPVTIFVRYADENATRDPAGPTLAVQRLPWDGILDMQYSIPQQQ
jgi:hypothetical protein